MQLASLRSDLDALWKIAWTFSPNYAHSPQIAALSLSKGKPSQSTLALLKDAKILSWRELAGR
jgi:hypothetical protein